MESPRDKHERTMAFAMTALNQIRALRQPAEPRDYELWYTYATGHNPVLNRTVNELLLQKSTLEAEDVDTLYNGFFSPTRVSDRIDTLGSQVVTEIDQVMSMIDAAIGSANSYNDSLADATARLGAANDREGLRAIVETLVKSTREVLTANENLEKRLKASRQEISELQDHLETVRHESLTDPLTGLSNRKYFDDALRKALANAETSGQPVSLLMVDIDHFKSFNDRFGHLTGDQVLRLVAVCMQQNLKGQDIAARYGGEEFAVILPQTGLRQALAVAEHVRKAVMGKELMKRSTGENLGRVTISIGVACYRAGDTIQGLIERADNCLYAAKRAGRNQTVCEADPAAGVAQVA